MEIAKTDNDIKVTVVTPSYNQGQFIEATILSVLNQTYKNIEYILVDGGSTDDTMAVVEKYRDRIDIIISEKDKGQSDAINKGFKLATGTLVGWINSDDVLYPDCVENIVNLHKQHPDGTIFNGKTLDSIDAEGKYLYSKEYDIKNRDWLLNDNFDVVQPGSFYLQEVVKKIGFLNPDIQYCMDLDLWLKLLEHGGIYSFNEKPIAAIRRWEGTKTSTGRNKFLAEIKQYLIKNGAKPNSSNLKQIKFRMFKNNIKKFFGI